MAVGLQQMHSVNPATEEPIASCPVHSEGEVDTVIDAAVARWPGWRATAIEDRCALIGGVGRL
jgi:acyl-CoA reductase-like NAD-dependent aldehyde dehydrogenase